MGAEIVDLYDEDGQVIGRAPRSQVRAQNLRHAATAVIVRDRGGRILVHRRTDTKDVYAGLYDFAAGGVLQAGEHADAAAARELFEEVGIGATPTRIGVAAYTDPHTTYLAFCYEVTYDVARDGPIRTQPEEVAWADWLTPTELLRRLEDPQWPFAPDSVALLRCRVEGMVTRSTAARPVSGR